MVPSALHWEKSFFESMKHFFDIRSKKFFFELKKVLLIEKNVLWSNEIDLFILKNIFLNQQNCLQFEEFFSLTSQFTGNKLHYLEGCLIV